MVGCKVREKRRLFENLSLSQLAVYMCTANNCSSKQLADWLKKKTWYCRRRIYDGTGLLFSNCWENHSAFHSYFILSLSLSLCICFVCFILLQFCGRKLTHEIDYTACHWVAYVVYETQRKGTHWYSVCCAQFNRSYSTILDGRLFGWSFSPLFFFALLQFTKELFPFSVKLFMQRSTVVGAHVPRINSNKLISIPFLKTDSTTCQNAASTSITFVLPHK